VALCAGTPPAPFFSPSAPSMKYTKVTAAMLPLLIAKLDRLIGAQLDCLLHHPQLQRLESIWRSLHLLTTDTATTRNVRLKLLDIRFEEITRDLDRALEYEQSQLFFKIHSNEFDHAGGEPFGLLLGDYQIDLQQRTQLDTLQRLSQITASAFAPFVCAATLALTDPDSSHLRQLRANANSRFLALVVPRIALRALWGARQHISGSLYYRERATQAADYLWGNAAFALAAVLIREFDNSGWFADARSSTWSAPTFAHGINAFAPLPLTDVIITEQRQRLLATMGLISLAHCWNTALCEFPAMPSLYTPAGTGERLSNSALQLAAQLPLMLCASRFAHCIKAMMREKIGSFASAADCERHIDSWLRQYTIASANHDSATLARFPLRAANVTIGEDKSQPGRYWCTISLTPHHRIDGVDAHIRLTSELARLIA